MATPIFDIANRAAAKGVHSLSAIPGPTVPSTNVGNLNVWFDPTSNEALRLSTLTNPSLGLQSAAVVNGNVTLMTGMYTTYVASISLDAIAYSLGDRFQSFSPSWSTKPNVSRFIISVLPTSVADASGFHRITQGLDTLPPLGGGVAGLERFNSPGYNNMEPDTIPTLVYVPVIAKLPFMHHVPNNSDVAGLDLQNEEIPSGTSTEGWISAMQWLLTNNNGESLHHASTMFDVANLQLNGAPFPQAGDLATTCNLNDTIVTLRDDGTNEHNAILAYVHDVVSMAAYRGGITPSDRGPPNTPDTVIKTMTATEENKLKATQRVQHFYRIFFAGHDANGNLVLPTLSKAFTDFLQETNPINGTKIGGESFQDFNNHECTRVLGNLASDTTFTGDDFYPYLVRCLLDGTFSKRILSYNPETIQKEFTIFNVLTPNKEGRAYKEVINEGHKAMELVSMGAHKSQTTTPTSILYTGGKARTRHDAKSAIANAILLFSWMLDNPTEHEPLVVAQLKLWSERLNVSLFKQSIDRMTEGPNSNKYLIAHILMDCQKALYLMADFACSAQGKAALTEPNTLATVLASVMGNFASFNHSKDADFSNGTLMEYQQCPPIWDYLGVSTGKPAATQQQQQSKNDTESPERKKQKKDKNQSPTSVTNSTGTSNTPSPKAHSIHGLLVAADGAGLPTLPKAIRAKNVMQNNSLTPLCRAHLVEGTICKNKDCKYAHVNASTFHARIPDVEHQKLFCDFVNNADSKFSWNKGALTPGTGS